MRTINKFVVGFTAAAVVGLGSPDTSVERGESSASYDAGLLDPFAEGIKRTEDDCRILLASIGGRAVDLAQVDIDRRLLAGASMLAAHYSSNGDGHDRVVSRRLSLIENRDISLVTENTLESTLSDEPKEDHIATKVRLFRRQIDGRREEALDVYVSPGCVTTTGTERHGNDAGLSHTIVVPNL